jgi:hypothetical protein
MEIHEFLVIGHTGKEEYYVNGKKVSYERFVQKAKKLNYDLGEEKKLTVQTCQL